MATEISEAVAAMILEHSQARAAQWQRRRESKARMRAERNRARDAGLLARHAAKIARSRDPEPI